MKRAQQLSVTIGPCFDFTRGRVQEKRTVVIAPITVMENKLGTIRIGYACSRGPFCEDPDCRYSKKAREVEGVEEV